MPEFESLIFITFLQVTFRHGIDLLTLSPWPQEGLAASCVWHPSPRNRVFGLSLRTSCSCHSMPGAFHSGPPGQWHSWQQFLSQHLGLSPGHLLPSKKSRPDLEGPRLVQQEFHVSTLAMLALLCRWSTTLKAEVSRTQAAGLLSSFLGSCLAPLDTCWPLCSPQFERGNPAAHSMLPALKARCFKGDLIIDPLRAVPAVAACLRAVAPATPSPLGTLVLPVSWARLALFRSGKPLCRAVCLSLLWWSALVVEQCELVACSSADPFCRACPPGHEEGQATFQPTEGRGLPAEFRRQGGPHCLQGPSCGTALQACAQACQGQVCPALEPAPQPALLQCCSRGLPPGVPHPVSGPRCHSTLWQRAALLGLCLS